MVDPTQLALIHAELDGELDERQRAELSRCLLADPALRAMRDEMRRLCRALDTLPQAEPPPRLAVDILAALPQTRTFLARSPWAQARWRYAALLAGILLTGALMFRLMDFGPGAARNEMSGTLAAPRGAVTVDMVQINHAGISGRASLIREGTELALSLELACSRPVDVLVVSGAHMLRVNGLATPGNHDTGPRKIALPGFGSEPIRLTFLSDGAEIGEVGLGGLNPH